MAQARRATLASLLPRLRIGAVSAIKGPYLVVRGRLRSYKIHIGSGHILMEPTDQYLCIVPRPQASRRLFLPFEGDEQLAVIISKALMLAEDDLIADQSIVRQIRR
ncbi:MAG TPA: hypothetical protein VGE07_29715, partial [Herpetosiphonaceae bacterium]